MDRTFVTTHTSWDQRQILAFVSPGGEAAQVYIDPIWGIHIDSVSVDGQPFSGEQRQGLKDDLNFRQIDVGAAPFIYKTLFRRFSVADTFVSTSSFSHTSYELPLESGRIEINYRPRFGPGVFGAPCLLVSIRV